MHWPPLAIDTPTQNSPLYSAIHTFMSFFLCFHTLTALVLLTPHVSLQYGHHMHDFDDDRNGMVTTISSHRSRAKRRKEPTATQTSAPASLELTVSPSSPSGSEPNPEAPPPIEPTNWCLTALATFRKVLSTIYCCHVENPHHIDYYSRVTFPLSFVMVNLLYWTYYLYF